MANHTRDTQDSLSVFVALPGASHIRDTQDALSVFVALPPVPHIRDTQDALSIFVPLLPLALPTKAYRGWGSKLQYSFDNSLFLELMQLQSFTPSGVELKTVDNTGINPASPWMTNIPTLLDAGKLTYKGILNPGSGSMQQVLGAQLTRTLLWWKITLPDGSTITFQGYVGRHVPVTVEVDKALGFSGEIEISGPMNFSWT